MEDLKKIIEQLRREKYFLYDVAYTEFDCRSISIDDRIYLEIDKDKSRKVPQNLARLMNEHLSEGLKLKPVKAEICFKSYTRKIPEQDNNKTDNRYGYDVEVDFEKREATPHECMCKPPNVRKIYEDIERIFRGCGWQFNIKEDQQ